MSVYEITEAGRRYYDFLGDPAHFAPDEQRVNEEKRTQMTRADWQCEQILVHLDAINPKGLTQKTLRDIFIRQHASCYADIKRATDEGNGSDNIVIGWGKTADGAWWAANNMDELIMLLLKRKLIEIKPVP